MNYPATNDHAGWFRDVRRIIDITEVTPGIPLPFISKDRASFYFTAMTRAVDAADAVSAARTILSYAFSVDFTPAESRIAGHDAFEALLPSGLLISLVTRAGRADPRAYAVGCAAAIHAEVAAMQPAGAVA